MQEREVNRVERKEEKIIIVLLVIALQLSLILPWKIFVLSETQKYAALAEAPCVERNLI